MTDYEYILEQCQQFNNSLWDDKVLKECIDKLKTLSCKELCDLLFEKEVRAAGNRSYSSYDNFEDYVENCDREFELNAAILKAIPTIKLVEIIYCNYENYIKYNGRLASMDFRTFRYACKLIREELRRRYLADIDCRIIENAFNHTYYGDKEWLKWQKRQRKIAESRYQDPFLKKLKDSELFVDDEFVEQYGYNHVISIKGCRSFWDADGKRLSAIHYILKKVCDFMPYFIGLGNEVVIAVESDDYGLKFDREWDSEYWESPLRGKIDEITRKANRKNLVLSCMLIEKFIHIVDPKVNARARYYDKYYLIGHFVIECPSFHELFTTIDTIASIKDLAPKGKKMDAFVDLVNNLLDSP